MGSTEAFISATSRCLIQPVSKNAGGLEDNDFPFSQSKLFGGLRVSSSPCRFFFHSEFTKTADQDVFAVFERLLNNLEKTFNDITGLAFAESDLIIHPGD